MHMFTSSQTLSLPRRRLRTFQSLKIITHVVKISPKAISQTAQYHLLKLARAALLPKNLNGSSKFAKTTQANGNWTLTTNIIDPRYGNIYVWNYVQLTRPRTSWRSWLARKVAPSRKAVLHNLQAEYLGCILCDAYCVWRKISNLWMEDLCAACTRAGDLLAGVWVGDLRRESREQDTSQVVFCELNVLKGGDSQKNEMEIKRICKARDFWNGDTHVHRSRAKDR
jgi:hypothetical protein